MCVAKVDDGIIWHYTDDNGLRGILEKGTLWLTDIFSLNDPSELRHGIDISLKVLKNVTDTKNNYVCIYESVKEIFSKGIRDQKFFFVCSFSKDSDDLGQWRAYANNGEGYALGFSTNILTTGFNCAFHGKDYYPDSFDVTYDDKKLYEIMTKELDKIIQNISKNIVDSTKENARTIVYELVYKIMENAFRFKHPAYSNENEYRFLMIQNANADKEKINTRFRKDTIIPYIEYSRINCASEALMEIKIGPAASEKKSKKFIDDCLKMYRPEKHIESKISDIPYRR